MSDQAKHQSNLNGALTKRHAHFTSGMIVAWGTSIGILLFGLMAYSQQPGDLSRPPLGSVLGRELDQTRHTLFVAIHPRCPCSSASLYELERLIARSKGRLHVTILVYFPAHEPEQSTPTNTIEAVASRTGIDWERDEDGNIAATMGCRTSGSVVLYNPAGQPLFWGGITSSRGHAGDNAGSDTILEILTQGSSKQMMTPVYGCSLTTRDALASHPNGALTHE